LKITGRLKEQYKLENGKYVVPAPLEDDLCRSHFIAQAIIYGENKPFNICLIHPDFVEVKNYLIKKGVKLPESGTNEEEEKKYLVEHPEIIQLLTQEVSIIFKP
jgi:long-chain acyl-CoA synthetase